MVHPTLDIPDDQQRAPLVQACGPPGSLGVYRSGATQALRYGTLKERTRASLEVLNLDKASSGGGGGGGQESSGVLEMLNREKHDHTGHL